MDHQSKQGQGQGHGKRKKSDEASASNGNGTSGFPTELVEKAEAAAAAEKQSVDKGIEAWKKVVASAPKEWAPRRELARVYKKAERWKGGENGYRGGSKPYQAETPQGVQHREGEDTRDKQPLGSVVVEEY